MAGAAGPRYRGGLLAACALIASILQSGEARSAGTAYAVDTAETTEPGGCKVESWVSFAANRDFFSAVNPACGVNLFTQMEFSVQVNRARSGGEWSTGISPKAKIKLVPTAIGSWGWVATVTPSYDAVTGNNTAIAFALPGTLRVSEIMRINLNAGLLWDRVTDRRYATYGLGFDLRTSDNIWTLTTEVFGQLGTALSESAVTQPRFQVGVRWRPVDEFSVDVIYGRNITGEDSNWITVGTTIRFPPQK